MKQLKLPVSTRSTQGRRPARRMRRDGAVPAVVYGKTEPRHLQIQTTDFTALMKATHGAAALIELEEGGTKTLSVIKEVQTHPVTDQVLHIDFHEVSASELMEANIAVHVNGEAIGVKSEKGLLEVVTHELTVRCLPKDLPEFIEVEIADLHVGQSIHVRELAEIPGVTVMADPDQVVVSCTEPRVVVESSTEEVAEEAAATT